MRQHKMFVFLLKNLEVRRPLNGPTSGGGPLMEVIRGRTSGGRPVEEELRKRSSGGGPQDKFLCCRSSGEGPLEEVLRNNSKEDVCK